MRTPLNTAVTFLREYRIIRDEMIKSVVVDESGINITLVFPTEAFVANFGSINFPEATVTKVEKLSTRQSHWTACFMWRKRKITLIMMVDTRLGVPVEDFSASTTARL